MLNKIIAGSLALYIFPGLLQAESQTKSFNAGITQLDLNNGAGKVNIVSSPDGKSKVRYNRKDADKNCIVTVDQVDAVLKVKARVDSVFSTHNCEVDFDIELPKQTDLNIKVGSSDVNVKDIKGKLIFSTGSGDINFSGEATEVEGRSGSASIRITGMNGDGDFKSGSGDLELTYLEVPKARNVSIKSGSGDSTIHLPAGSAVKASLKSGSGDVTNAFASSDGSGLEVNAKTGSGDLNLIKM